MLIVSAAAGTPCSGTLTFDACPGRRTLDTVFAGAKVSAIVDAITALRAKLGGGNESPIVTKSGGAGIVRRNT